MRALATVVTLCVVAALPVHAATLPRPAERALQNILDGGRASHSAAVVVWQDNRELGHYYAGGKPPGPVELMSVTKSLVALAIGQLLGSGHITSLDEPVADFYPEWKQGQKKNITIRMLMNHTSGLQADRNTGPEVYPAPDAVQLALAAELTSKPGAAIFYNNKATNLLSGIVLKASGKPLDVFLGAGLFKALDIHQGDWQKDKAGNPYGMSGAHLTAADEGKLAQLMIDKGRWNGQQLLPEAFVSEVWSSPDSEGRNLLWWQAPRWTHFDADPAVMSMLRKRGVPEDTVVKLQHALAGAHFESTKAMYAGLRKALGDQMEPIIYDALMSRGIGPYALFKMKNGPIVGYNGEGDGGQYVVAIPAANIVAVRQIEAGGDDEQEGEDYSDFVQRVIALAEAEGRLGRADP